MEYSENTSFFPLLFRFYSHALVFPYDELRLELEHIFRELELQCENNMHEHFANRALDVLNNFVETDINGLQGEFGRMFGLHDNIAPPVGINFTDYSASPEVDDLLDKMYESELALNFDEAPESITNLLDYFSLIVDSGEALSLMPLFTSILQGFGKRLIDKTSLQYYDSIGKALLELNQIIAD